MDAVFEPGDAGLVIVRGAPGCSLLDLDPARVREAYQLGGALWFRGFQVRPQEYLDFIRQFTSELITLNSYERVRHRAVHEIQSVTGGDQALNFHTEMGHVPGRPHLLSFWCEIPSSRGGETLLADGVALWEALSEGTRQLFTARRVRYVMRVPHAWWTDRLGGDRPEDVAHGFAGIPDATCTLEPDGTLVIRWIAEAAFRPMFGDRLGFASNLFSYVVPGLTFGFEDGAPVPQAVLAELEATATRVAAEIAWSPGEVVLFDNTRWLHGRRAVAGLRRRRVHMLQGYASFAPEGSVRLATRRLEP